MEKKGNVSIAYMLTTIIAVAFVVMIVIFLMNENNSGIIQSVKNILPTFGYGTTVQGNEGNIRYDILTSDVRYFDGASWKKVSQPIEFYSLNGAASEEQIRQAFDDFYFDKAARGSTTIFENDAYLVRANGITKSATDNWDSSRYADYKRGAVDMTILAKGAETGALVEQRGFMFVDLDGSNDYEAASAESVGFDSRSLLNNPLSDKDKLQAALNAAAWRDSVLSRPMNLEGGSFCARKMDNHYLLIDLSKPGKTSC